jgi:hypothetical protein
MKDFKVKKPFLQTKVGKLLTSPLVKTGLEMVPLGIGSAVSSLLNKNETPEGVISREALVKSLVKIAIYAILVYMVFSNKIDWQQASDAKDFIQN